MKILVVLSDIQLPAREGLFRQSLLLLRTLSNEVDTSIYAFHRSSTISPIAVDRATGARLIGSTSYRGSSVLFALTRSSGALLKAARRINEQNADIVILEGPVAIALARHINAPARIANWVDPGSLRFRRLAVTASRLGQRLRYRLAAEAYRLLERRAERDTWTRVYVSSEDARAVRATGDSSAVAIPIIADSRNYSEPPTVGRVPPGRKRILIYVDGRIAHGRRALLASLRDLRDSTERRHVDVRVMARVPADRAIRESAKGLRLTVLEWVEDPRIEIMASDITVIPDVAGTGLKNRTLEAIALSKCVLATPVALEGMPLSAALRSEVQYEHGKLAPAVTRILDGDMSQSSRLADERQMLLHNFSAQAVAERWLELCRTMHSQVSRDAEAK